MKDPTHAQEEIHLSVVIPAYNEERVILSTLEKIHAYLARLGPDVPVRSLQDIIAFNEQHRDRVMPYFGQERMLLAQEKGPLTDEAYLEALETNHRLARTEGIDATLEENKLDAIVAPSGGPACLTDWDAPVSAAATWWIRSVLPAG